MILSAFKEIVTKAIIGKGKKFFKNNYSVEAKEATNVLGCWVINHNFNGVRNKLIFVLIYEYKFGL